MSATVFLGYRTNHALGILHDRLRERTSERVVFLDLARYPRRLPFHLRVCGGEVEGCFYPEGEEPLGFSEVGCVYAHHLAVIPEPGATHSAEEWNYIATECWAALIAILEGLRRTATVANFVSDRQVLETHLSRLAFLAGYGLPVAPTMVTSSPGAAGAFARSHKRVTYRAVTGPASVADRDLQPADLERLGQLRLAPALFQAPSPGELVWLAVVGDEAIVCPHGAQPPEPELIEACLAAVADLGLQLAEVVLRRLPDGSHQVVDLFSFLSPGTLASSRVLDLALSLAVEGALR